MRADALSLPVSARTGIGLVPKERSEIRVSRDTKRRRSKILRLRDRLFPRYNVPRYANPRPNTCKRTREGCSRIRCALLLLNEPPLEKSFLNRFRSRNNNSLLITRSFPSKISRGREEREGGKDGPSSSRRVTKLVPSPSARRGIPGQPGLRVDSSTPVHLSYNTRQRSQRFWGRSNKRRLLYNTAVRIELEFYSCDYVTRRVPPSRRAGPLSNFAG